MNGLFPHPAWILADAAGAPRTWTLSHEGIAPEWALLTFLLLAGVTAFSYLRLKGKLDAWRLAGMGTLRLLACALLAALITLPVIRFIEQKPVRQPWAVLVDNSQSMQLPDRREATEDLNRAAIAMGAGEQPKDLATAPAAEIADKVRGLSRMQLVEGIAANPRLNLWPRVAAQADLEFHSFGEMPQREGGASIAEGASGQVRFPALKADQPATAIGDALVRLLKESRGRALGGVIVVSDGGNNKGSPPLEAARLAKEKKIPLFLYGVGVASPPDIEVLALDHPSLAFVGERMEVRARIAVRGFEGLTQQASLKADGAEIGTSELNFSGEEEQEVRFQVVPSKAGELKLEVSVPVQAKEVSGENNRRESTVRVTDRKFDVLLIEQEPRWDFRYLLDYLERDPRLKVRCAMIDGEPGLSQGSESTFLPAVPNTREGIFASQVLILGDVKPADLGRERMEIIADWVEAGGGIIFLAGSHFNPGSYEGTPLEPLLPVVAEPMRANDIRQRRERSPFPLELTAAGRRSPYLRMASGDEENLKIWEGFPGVRWVAPVLRAKPGAEVLLVDSRASSSGRHGKMPVFAMQSHGSGKCVYFGTDETYRWRSKAGQKYYSILWGQIMQSLALQLLDSASALTQLKTDRVQYRSGDRVTISGKAYEEGYVPLMLPSLEGVLTIQADGQTTTQTRPLTLNSIDRNSFRAEFNPTQPGKYTFHTLRDPEGTLHFEVVDSNEEKLQTSLDATLLKEMAGVAGGRFLREEELDLLPGWISAATTKVDIHRKVELYRSPWLLAALIALFSSEWLWRRLNRLK